MNYLITSDLHLSDRPRDSYRFGLFKWLARQQQLNRADATFILGDITERKDNHPSTLVNRIVDELIGLKPPVYILKGNHDFIDPDNPYFRFLNCIDGVYFITTPTTLHGFTMIPHCRDQTEFNAACDLIKPQTGVLIHQTLNGAKAESGARLAGLQATPIEAKHPLGCWAGDVHRPQRHGLVTYVGAPYTVRFGDDFQPRVLLLKGKKEQNLYFNCPRKWSLTVTSEDDIVHNEDLRAGDQVKLIVELAREEVIEWTSYRQSVLAACKDKGLEVYGCKLKINTNRRRERITLGEQTRRPEETLTLFCTAENVASNFKKAGLQILR